MAFNNNITPGAAPLLWSEVYAAFTKVNENFDILVATIGDGSGLTPINFETLDTSLKPTVDDTYDLGDITHKWGAIYSSEHTLTEPLNGLWLGNAQIKGVGYTVNLPANSTIGGDPLTGIGTSLIIDPDKTFFKTVQVDNEESVVANDFADTLNLNSGTAVQLVVDSAAESITINNTGATSLIAGSGVSVSSATGDITVTNTGVRSLTSTTALPSGRTAGAGINIDNSTGDGIKITNTGILSISSGVGITVSLDAASGDVTVTNSAPAVNAYTQFEINGDSANRISADAVSDVLFINSGEGITLTKNISTDTLTFAVNPVFDLKGSVFGDDSSILVDAVSNYIYGNVSATTLRTSDVKIALGSNAGQTNQGNNTIAIGSQASQFNQGVSSISIGGQAGQTSQGASAVAVGAMAGNDTQGIAATAVGPLAGRENQGLGSVAIGSGAGQSGQGTNAVAIGYDAGSSNQPANSIVINATGSTLNGSAAGFFVDPIRSTANGRPLMYDTTTKELFSSNVLEFVGSTISTSDSSGLTVDVLTTFNTDVVFENDIIIAERLTVKGSRVINLTELKTVIAASVDFADFQARIAALV